MSLLKGCPTLLLSALFGVLALPACNEPVEPGNDVPEAAVEAAPATTVTQAVVDADSPNWFVAGGDGNVEMVGGTDGEPDDLTGRFVLDGNVISSASAGTDRWIVGGVGQIQAVDKDALRLAEVRNVLQGEAVRTINGGNDQWFVGGDNGRAQTLDAFGEPTTNEGQFFGGTDAIVGAAWNGLSWIVAGKDKVAICDASLTSASPEGQTIDGISDIRAIVSVGEFTSGGALPVYIFGANSVTGVSAFGTPSAGVVIDSALDITTAVYGNGKIAVGTSDGKFGFFNEANQALESTTNVLGGASVNQIVWNGSEFLLLGEGGVIQSVSGDGTPGALVQLPAARTAVAAWFVDNRWLIAVGEIGFVLFRDADLSEVRTVSTVLGGSAVLAGDAGLAGILVGGEGGKVRALNADGEATGEVATSEAKEDINAVAYNGTVYLAAGDNGWAQMVGDDGAFLGDAFTFLGGANINFVAWNGDTWLIGGDGNQVQRVRADGTEAGTPVTLETIANLYDARWSGGKWIVVGESTDGNAAYAFVGADGAVDLAPAEIAEIPGAAYAAEFNGTEFLVGGSGGMIQRISNEGVINGAAFDALNGYDILDIYFNGANFMVGGQFGAVRRLSPSIQPLRVPLSVLDQQEASVVLWTRARGFAGGVCLTAEVCYEGPCVGGLAEGKCCDSACDRACESCFNRDTGEDDGVCAPVVAGKQPPAKPGGPSTPCARESEATCGRTGVCDGAGECAYYGAEVQCGEPSCSNGDFTPVSTCDSAGACAIAQSMPCAPYVGCNIENGCQTACAANTDCIEGYECVDEACVEEGTQSTGSGSDSGGDSDDGGCSVVDLDDVPTEPGLLLIAGLGLFVAGRRR